MADLDKLKTEIAELGDKIKELKSSGGGGDVAQQVKALVDSMLDKKKQYAENNGGIGVDGNPYPPAPLTKAEKKAKAKADKAAAAAAAGGGDGGGPGPAKPQPDPNSAGAQKKAAKKAAKKAQKQAMKEGGGGGDAGAGGGGSGGGGGGAQKLAAAGAAGGDNTPAPAAAEVPVAHSILHPACVGGNTAIAVSLQMAVNPNHELMYRPVVALTVASLTDTAADLDVVADHRRPHSAMSTEAGEGGESATTIVGDVAMARYLLSRAPPPKNKKTVGVDLLPKSPSRRAAVDSWVDYSQSLMRFPESQRVAAVTLSVETALGGGGFGRQLRQTYLVGESMTLADVCAFAALGFPTQHADRVRVLELVPDEAKATRRWIEMMAGCPALMEATQLAIGVASNREAAFDDVASSEHLEPLVPGMNTLEGAIPGRVVTRFPPEPSGYLHIGHAKACLLNDYYARRYRGRLLLRFDDTNPSKEKEEFQNAIVEDLATLGVKPDSLSYTSDYLEVIADYARQLINEGKAFMDDTPQEQMKQERIERQESRHRNQSSEEALEKFKVMCSGSEEGAKWCLRAKIDMSSDNGTMRDPVLFRQNLTPHHRTGTTYKAYPTYDLACPIVDSLEGVTHALRTTEYNDRDEQYQWVLKALGLRRVRIHAFARMNFVNTVLSKRKLTWFVDNGYVTGWDDPRFPTVRGVVRRGINIPALRNFMYSQGASRRVVNMDWTVFWSENKKEIDKTAKRFMAIDKARNVRLTVSGAPAIGDFGYVETSYHPKDPNLGTRALRIANEVLLETGADVEGIEAGEEIVLLRWGVVKITKVVDASNLEGAYVPDGDFKAAKRKLSWVANVSNNTPVILTEFDNLVSKDKLDEDDDFLDYINPDTLATTEVIGDTGLKTLCENEVIQLERRGYFRVDRPYLSADKPLLLFTIPDGKSKAMSGQQTKLAHR